MSKDKFLTVYDIALYFDCECEDYTNNSRVIFSPVVIYQAYEEEWKLKPYLRPLSDLKDDELLAVCELANGMPFVNKKKWEIDRRRNDVIYVKSKRSEYSFAVYIHKDTGYGDITIFKEYDVDPEKFDPLNPNAVEIESEAPGNISLITKFYLDHYLDCFGWIDQNYALDKTKQNG